MKSFRITIEIILGVIAIAAVIWRGGILDNKVNTNTCEISRVESKSDRDMAIVSGKLEVVLEAQTKMFSAINVNTALLRQHMRDNTEP